MLALTFSEILTFQIIDLQKVGQGRGVQFSQYFHSMANIKIYKSRPYIFGLPLTVSEIGQLNFQFFLPSKVGHGNGIQFSRLRHSMAIIKINKRHFLFCQGTTCGNESNRHTDRDSQTDRHSNGQPPGYWQNGKSDYFVLVCPVSQWLEL